MTLIDNTKKILPIIIVVLIVVGFGAWWQFGVLRADETFVEVVHSRDELGAV